MQLVGSLTRSDGNSRAVPRAYALWTLVPGGTGRPGTTMGASRCGGGRRRVDHQREVVASWPCRRDARSRPGDDDARRVPRRCSFLVRYDDGPLLLVTGRELDALSHNLPDSTADSTYDATRKQASMGPVADPQHRPGGPPGTSSAATRHPGPCSRSRSTGRVDRVDVRATNPARLGDDGAARIRGSRRGGHCELLPRDAGRRRGAGDAFSDRGRARPVLRVVRRIPQHDDVA